MRPIHSFVCHLLLLCILATLTGCHGTRRGDLSVVKPVSEQDRVGRVYLVRGLVGVFSTGMDELSVKIRQQGIAAEVFQGAQRSDLAKTIASRYAEHPDHEPLVLIGHSYGADDVLRIARELEAQKITVDVLVTCDPVTPPPVPGNIKRLYNYYKSNGKWDTLPWLRGIPLHIDNGSPVQLSNFDLADNRRDLLEKNTNHFNIEKNPRLHEDIIRRLVEICPPRSVWTARNGKMDAAVSGLQ
jgi:pimeloyl-ACP methyl ester carboxylesterase